MFPVNMLAWWYEPLLNKPSGLDYQEAPVRQPGHFTRQA